MTGAGKDESGPGDRWHGEFERRNPDMARARAHYSGWLIGFLQVGTVTGTAEGILIEDPAAAGPAGARWEPGQQYLIRQVPEAGGAWWRCRPVSIYPQDPPAPEAVLVTSPARFGDADPEPSVPAWAPGTDGVGPSLLAADGTPVRWLLVDGYVYDIRDDQDQPPWQEGRWAVNEWRPQTTGEMKVDPPASSP